MTRSGNRLLLIILLVLAGVYLISTLLSSDGQRSFDPLICDLDTSVVDEIRIDPKDSEAYRLERRGDGWRVVTTDFEAPAKKSAVASLLAPLDLMKAKRIVAKSDERYSEFEVGNEHGTSLEVYNDGEKLTHLIIGRLQFDQQARSATTYVRPANETNVYAVDGFFSASYNNPASGFRDNRLTAFESDQVDEIIFEDAQSSRSILKEDSFWKLNEEIIIDSSTVQNYLTSVSSLTGKNFASDLTREYLPDRLSAIEFRGARLREPIRIESFRVDTSHKFLLYSTQNPESVFQSDSSGIYQKLFPPVKALFDGK